MNADERTALETEKQALQAREAQLLDKLVAVHAKLTDVNRRLTEGA